MTIRKGQPDTDADRDLRLVLGRRSSGFVMVAGAGSGKTTSLIKALEYLSEQRGADLKRRNQKVACITYTEVAVGEIWGDVGNSPLFPVSTIHSFLWSVVRPFQSDLKSWVLENLDAKIGKARERLANNRTKAATRPGLQADIDRYEQQKRELDRVPSFTYGTGSDYLNGILGHDDILKVGPLLIQRSQLLRSIIAQRFPYIFVDESQDANPEVVEALRTIANQQGLSFCLGFFGDPMQKIYPTGAGAIPLSAGWEQITKPDNFRCPSTVLGVINRIRAEDDGLDQTGGRMETVDGVRVPVEGAAHLFILPTDGNRTQRLQDVRRWMSREYGDEVWLSDDDASQVRALVIVHRMAAIRLGFPGIYSALNDHGDHALKDGLLDGTAWILKPLLNYLMPLVSAERASQPFEVIASLRKNCPILADGAIAANAVPAALQNLQASVTRLVELLAPTSTATIRDVYTYVKDQNLAKLDDRFAELFAQRGQGVEDRSEEAAADAFMQCPAKELWGYQKYIEDESPFATQQGVKGAEFERVLVVLDDEEGQHTHFSYGKYFGFVPLSEKDEENIGEGKDSVLGRTRRLFYVCCSRARLHLAVVLFVPDVSAAQRALEQKRLFIPATVHDLESLQN